MCFVDVDPIDHTRRLAACDEPGGIVVAGGVGTVRTLLHGGVDTGARSVPPAIAGRRLFDDTVPVTRPDLVDHTITAPGNAVLTCILRS